MINKLKDAEKRYIDIEKQLADPEVFSDNERFATLMKDYKALTPIIEKYREYVSAEEANAEAKALSEEALEYNFFLLPEEKDDQLQKAIDVLFN